MPYTGTEIFDHAIRIIDELSDTGAVVESQVRDYKYRAPGLLDIWQHENRDLRATATIIRRPLDNLLGTRFDVLEHVDEDVIFEVNAAARTAVFSVADQAEVYIEVHDGTDWTGASGYYAQDDGEETAFTGLISVPALTAPAVYKARFTPGQKTRLRFSGDYYYLFSNFALFKAAFPSCAKIPDYSEYVRYSMPDNFSSETQIVTEAPMAGFSHKWENNRLMVHYDYAGTIKVTYRPNPVKITDLSQPLEISEGSAIAGAYYLAAHFAIADQANPELAALCLQKYQEIQARVSADAKRPQAPTKIQDVYNIGR
jgi:hypothetical protein